MLGPSFPVVHNQLLCLADVKGEVVVLALRCQVSDDHSLIIVGDQFYHHCVVSKLDDDDDDDDVGVMHSRGRTGRKGGD